MFSGNDWLRRLSSAAIFSTGFFQPRFFNYGSAAARVIEAVIRRGLRSELLGI
jgi:hypothetical protein